MILGITASSIYKNIVIPGFTVNPDADDFTYTLGDTHDPASNLYQPGMYITDDGVDLYTTIVTGTSVLRYTLATPFEVNTASLTTTFNFTGRSHLGITFDPTGTYIFLTGQYTAPVEHGVFRYTLNTPWDIATIDVATRLFKRPEDMGLYPNIKSVQFNPAGTIMTVNGITSPYSQQLTLSTPWDITTATKDVVTLLEYNTYSEVKFSPDGTKFYLTDNQAFGVPISLLSYSNSVPYTLQGAQLTGTLNLATEINADYTDDGHGLCISSDGKNLYINADGGSDNGEMDQLRDLSNYDIPRDINLIFNP